MATIADFAPAVNGGARPGSAPAGRRRPAPRTPAPLFTAGEVETLIRICQAALARQPGGWALEARVIANVTDGGPAAPGLDVVVELASGRRLEWYKLSPTATRPRSVWVPDVWSDPEVEPDSEPTLEHTFPYAPASRKGVARG